MKDWHCFLDGWFKADIVLNFITAYYEAGFLITQPRRIAMHYIKTWFVIDIVASVPWAAFFPTVVAESGFNRKTIKLIKYVKLPKMLRLGRLLRHFQMYLKYTGITSIVCGFLFLLHLIATTWANIIDPCRNAEIEECTQSQVS